MTEPTREEITAAMGRPKLPTTLPASLGSPALTLS